MENIVTMVLTVRGGRRAQVSLPWSNGKSLRSYLKDPVLQTYGAIEIALRSRITNQHFKKVRLVTPLNPGDIIFLSKAA